MEKEEDSPSLAFTSHNPSGSTTILLIHGAFGSPKDFDPLVRDLLPERLINTGTDTECKNNTDSSSSQGCTKNQDTSELETHTDAEPETNPETETETSALLSNKDKEEIHSTSSTNKNTEPPKQNEHYHILIPSLPMHSTSSHIQPLTIPHTVSLLATLLQKYNHMHPSTHPSKEDKDTRRVHVIGYSLGAHIAASLASSHPTLVTSVLVTGFNIFPACRRWTPTILPGLLFMLNLIEGAIMFPAETWEKIKDWVSGRQSVVEQFKLCRAVIAMLFSDRELGRIDGDRVRVGVVAATREGWIPKDKVESARRLFQSIDFGSGIEGVGDGDGKRKGEGKGRVVQHKGLTHAWPVEEPELMGRMVRAWVERGEMVEGFEDI